MLSPLWLCDLRYCAVVIGADLCDCIDEVLLCCEYVYPVSLMREAI